MEVYVNDMLVKSLRFKDHFTHLVEMFDVLCIYGMKLNLSKCVFGVSLGKFLGFMVNQWGMETNLNKIMVVLEMEASRTISKGSLTIN